MPRPRALLLLLLAVPAGCDDGGHGTGYVTSVDAPGRDGVLSLDVAAPRDAGTDVAAGFVAGPFVQGINLTRSNPAWTTADLAVLASMTSADGVRVPLPESTFPSAGGDVQALLDHGLRGMIGVLGPTSRAHSTAAATVSDADLARYIPSNLYRPFMDANGNIPVDNYWAAYVYRVVVQYGGAIRVWQVWDEPDAETTIEARTRWATAPPTAAELPRLHGSIFDYVRMLRITSAVVHALDPSAVVLAGGIESPEFLAAAARYSDDPAGGGLGGSYPAAGVSYFDAVGLRHFPAGDANVSSDSAAAAFVEHLSALRGALGDASAGTKRWFVTATGAAHVALSGAPSGPDFARNYAVKVVTRARGAALDGLFWHQLCDTAADGASADSMSYTGLFLDVAKLADTSAARRVDTAEAFRSIALALAGTTPDAAAMASLALPPDVCGQTFRDADGARLAVLWACGAAAVREGASANYQMPAQSAVTVRRWDWALTREVQSYFPTSGVAAIPLTSSPVIVAGGQ